MKGIIIEENLICIEYGLSKINIICWEQIGLYLAGPVSYLYFWLYLLKGFGRSFTMLVYSQPVTGICIGRNIDKTQAQASVVHAAQNEQRH